MYKNRKSIRLKDYDYSQAGMYFVTICCQNRAVMFGEIKDNEMFLNDAGEMVEKWCAELSNKFSDIALDTYIIMPNHFHVIIAHNDTPVGADLRVCPYEIKYPHILERPNILGEHIGLSLRSDNNNILGEHIGSPLRSVVQWFKTMTTNEYIRGVKNFGWQPFNKKLWQRNYYEHVIRNFDDYTNIAKYIINNPCNWNNDELKP